MKLSLAAEPMSFLNVQLTPSITAGKIYQNILSSLTIWKPLLMKGFSTCLARLVKFCYAYLHSNCAHWMDGCPLGVAVQTRVVRRRRESLLLREKSPIVIILAPKLLQNIQDDFFCQFIRIFNIFVPHM